MLFCQKCRLGRVEGICRRRDTGTRGIPGSMGCRRVTLGVITETASPGQGSGLHFCPFRPELVDLLCVDSQAQVDHLVVCLFRYPSYQLARIPPVVALQYLMSQTILVCQHFAAMVIRVRWELAWVVICWRLPFPRQGVVGRILYLVSFLT